MAHTQTILTSEEMDELQMLVDEMWTQESREYGTVESDHVDKLTRIAHILGLEVGE